MKIRIIYYLEEAFSSFRHNWVMSFAAILVVLISVLLVGSFIMIGHVVEQIASDIEEKVEIDVYLKDKAPKEDLYSLERKVKAIKDVDSVEFISKKEALEIFKKRNKNNKDLISNIPGNPLPASYRIFLKDPQKIENVATKIKEFSENETTVEEIKYGREFVRKIFAVTRWIRIIMFVLIVFMIFASLALISNTIRLAIYARRKEIAIMRLVGASNWFIRWPYLLEGTLQGLTGAALAIGILASVKYVLQGKLEDQLSWLMTALKVSPIFYQNLLLMLLTAGIVIGAAGSLIALRRYLKT